MQRRARARISLLTLTVLLAGGCDDPPAEGVDAEGASRTEFEAAPASSESAATRAALPGLFNIMIGLQADMARVSRGIWLADFDSIAAGARAVAEHPRIPSAELQVIRQALGDDIVRFQELDTRVHDLAVELAEHAEAADTAAVLDGDAALRSGCVACHQGFRDRLREEIGSPPAGPAPDSANPGR